MSYEGKMLEDLKMPPRKEVELILLKSIFQNNGVIKEFGADEKIVDELANDFGLTEKQRTAFLETIYRKENRIKKSYLWHRLLFRAADALAKEKLITRPTQTYRLTKRREWMLTEDGYNHILEKMHIPLSTKEILPVKSYEVQRIVKRLTRSERPINYEPFEYKKTVSVSQDIKLRNRAFSQAVKEIYGYKCAVCGLKLKAPTLMVWEVEAAHIVPYKANGKDDILNGLALCRLHHWAFDVGWFTLEDNFRVLVSQKMKNLSDDFGKIGGYNLIDQLTQENLIISLPYEESLYPHPKALKWHREKIFCP